MTSGSAMITLKYFGDHMRELRQMLWASSCSGSGDLLLVSSDGNVHAHRLLVVAYMPSLAHILAPACDGKHEQTTILLPEISLSKVKEALEDLYTKEDPLKLANIFSDTSFIGSLDNLEQIFKKELTEGPEERFDKTGHNPADFCQVTLMNGETVIQCQNCLEAVATVSDHVCPTVQEKSNPRQILQEVPVEEIKLNFEVVVFKNDAILYRCLHCNSQFKEKDDAGGHMKTHQNALLQQEKSVSTGNKNPLNLANRGAIKRVGLVNNEIKCKSRNYTCANKMNMSKHRKKLHLDISRTATVSFSLDHFIAKLNRKKEKIFVCRKCLKKCRGELGAKMHSKMKCGKNIKFILPKSDFVHEKSSFKEAEDKRKVPALENDVKEMLLARKNIEVTRTTEFGSEAKKIFLPRKCDICEKTFPSSFHLKSHIERSHDAQVEGFESSFTKLDMGGGREAFECKKCGKKCTTVSGMTRHQLHKKSCRASKKVKAKETRRNLSSKTAVSCDQCRKVCTSNRYLGVHKRRKHPTKI